jgi:hypothetical protein
VAWGRDAKFTERSRGGSQRSVAIRKMRHDEILAESWSTVFEDVMIRRLVIRPRSNSMELDTISLGASDEKKDEWTFLDMQLGPA